MAEEGVLRGRLRGAEPMLHAHLERSWAIALEGWLHALEVKEGSANSYPHLRNTENHLDSVVTAFETPPSTSFRGSLSPIEIYVLLSAVLFHDIGRTQPGAQPHATKTRLLLETGFAHLGLPDRELARSVASICEAHSPDSSMSETHSTQLAATAIDPYGEIREDFLAALLTLGDTMDAAYTRALPEYLTGQSGIGAVGWFRRMIRGVYVDPATRLVRTVLAPVGTMAAKGRGTATRDVSLYHIGISRHDGGCPCDLWRELIKTKGKTCWRTVAERFASAVGTTRKGSSVQRLDDIESSLTGLLGVIDEATPRGQYLQQLGALGWKGGDEAQCLLSEVTPRAPLLHGLFTLGLLELRRSASGHVSEADGIRPMPSIGLAIVLGDTNRNRETLKRISPVLARSGIHLDAWLVEKEEHLYNVRGCESFEPVLSQGFLGHVANGMWELSAQVFGVCRFSYDDLASFVGESDTSKVHMAVRRIGVVTDGLLAPMSRRDRFPAVWAGDTHWEWCVDTLAHGRCCSLTSRDEVMARLESLEKAHEPYGSELGRHGKR